MTPPTWLDAQARRRPRLACWTCGREVAPMCFRATDLRPHGWRPPQTLQNSGLVRALDRVSAGARGRLVVPRADLGAGAESESDASLSPTGAALGANLVESPTTRASSSPD